MLQTDPNTRVKKGTEDRVWRLPPRSPPPNRKRAGTLKRRHGEMERSVRQGLGTLPSAKWGWCWLQTPRYPDRPGHIAGVDIWDTLVSFLLCPRLPPHRLCLNLMLCCFRSTAPLLLYLLKKWVWLPITPPTQAAPNTTSPHPQVAGQTTHSSLLYQGKKHVFSQAKVISPPSFDAPLYLPETCWTAAGPRNRALVQRGKQTTLSSPTLRAQMGTT